MRNTYRISLLGLICISLLLPKALLLSYMNSALWGGFGAGRFAQSMLQDAIVAWIAFGLLMVLTAKPALWRYCLGAVATSLILALLLIDARVRELWLRPLQWDLVGYFRQNAGDLSSGFDVFTKQHAGLGMTFRRFGVLALAVHWALWGAAIFVARVRPIGGVCSRRQRILRYALACACVFVLVGAAALVRPQLYQADRNILVGWTIDLFRPNGSDIDRQLADEFTQKFRPLADAIGHRSAANRDIPPFKNVIIVILESVRWSGLNIDTTDHTDAPTLRKLATEGLLAKCYVSLPHSSKSQFAILTGAHPSGGVEIREAMRRRSPSVIWSLREHHGAKTFCFSVQHLPFENTSGMLRSCGLETLVDNEQLRGFAGTQSAAHSSFGDEDSVLVALPTKMLGEANKPFAAVFITMAAHHPYNYPGKPVDEGFGQAAYWHSIAYSDGILAQMLRAFNDRGILRDTLVVLVGDHGESFGEHGTFIHNNSMYEEEVTIPLILWSSDGRLRGHSIPKTARQIDIAPTIADLMGLADDGYRVQGRSLLGDLRDEPAYAMSFFKGVSAMMVRGTEKVIYLPGNDQVARFDLGKDLAEHHPMPLSGAERERAIRELRAFQAYQQRAFDEPG